MSTEEPRITKDNHRRNFIRESLLLAAAPASMIGSSPQAVAKSIATRPSVVRLGVIGCGYRGVRLTQTALASSNVQLHAVADLRPDRIQQLYRTLNGQYSLQMRLDADSRFQGAKAAQLLASCDLDAVIVATPPEFKPDILVQLLQTGKHVYVEAPLALDIAGIRQLKRLSEMNRDNSLTVRVGLQPEGWAPFSEMLRQGAIGDQIFAEATLHAKAQPCDTRSARDAHSQGGRSGSYPDIKFIRFLEPLIETIELLNCLNNDHPLQATSRIIDESQAVLEYTLSNGLHLRCNLILDRTGQNPLSSLRIQGSAGWCDLTKGQLYGPANQLLAVVPPLSRRLNLSLENWMQQLAGESQIDHRTELYGESVANETLIQSIKTHQAAFLGLGTLS